MWKAAIVLSAALWAAGCSKPGPGESGLAASGGARPISIAYTTQPQSALIHVAVAKNYLAEVGLEPKLLMHSFGQAALQSVLEGQADVATVSETPVMFSILKGDKIFVLANIDSSTRNHAIVANVEAGIRTAADLQGKRVGYTPGTTGEFFLEAMLTSKGLAKSDIVPVALKPDEMEQAIVSRQIDAASTGNYPLTLIKHRLGPHAVIFYDEQIYTQIFNIAAQQAFVHANGETVKRFLKALLKAEAFVAQHPEQAQDIVAAAAKVDRKLVQEVWDAFHHRLTLDQALQITLEDETRWAMKNKLTDRTAMPNYASYIHPDGLLAVKPEAVLVRK